MAAHILGFNYRCDCDRFTLKWGPWHLTSSINNNSIPI
nr:hypothetical protein [Escherichia coli]